jgi:nitroreductase
METTMDYGSTATDHVLARAARTAGLAPSIHNTQPWRWRIHASQADLYADLARHLKQNDPDRRMLTLSAGAALHHMTTALAAGGYRAEVTPLPDQSDPLLLARVVLTGKEPAPARALQMAYAIRSRHTDRRPLLDVPLPDGAIDALRSAVTEFGIGLDPLDRNQVIDLASATYEAQQAQVTDPAALGELEHWAGDSRPPFAGVPASVIPDRPAETTVPTRDFGHVGRLPLADTHDNAATYVILYGMDDEPGSWLRAGEALSALWLTATDRGIAVMPLSVAAEEPATRFKLRQILSGVGYPYIAVRLGTPDPEGSEPPRTPRLKPEVTIEVVE